MNPLGRSGLSVSALSLGTMNFGADWHGVGAIDDKAASSLIDLALERGVNLIDTADIYGRGAAEEMLGRILKGRRKKVLLATKVLGQMDLDDPSTGGLSARWVKKALDASLKRLKTDHVDLYMPHGWDREVPLEETLKALESAVKAGKVRVPGCSNFSGEQLASARGRFAFDQVQYSLAARFPENDLVPVAERDGVSLVSWSPLAGGLLSGKYASAAASGRRTSADAFPYVEPQRGAALVKVLRAVAALEGSTCAQAALGWIMGKPFVASATLGARTTAQLSELLDAKPLSPRAAALLDRASELCSRP
ncbi:MAG: aldo/keto reductase [Elusimicrobia bacterium]|nr:aldo/keto reductase [Elusimicrobiota bacterium]